MDCFHEVKSSLVKIIMTHPLMEKKDAKVLKDILTTGIVSNLDPENNNLVLNISNLFKFCHVDTCTADEFGNLLAEFIMAPTVCEHIEKITYRGRVLFIDLKTSYLASSIIGAVLGGSYLSKHVNPTGKRVMIENSQPNFCKSFHLGHVRNVTLGDCMTRVHEQLGDTVISANYFGDEGAHIAVTLFQMEQSEMPILDKGTREKAIWMNTQYAMGKSALDLASLTKFPFPGVYLVNIMSREGDKYTFEYQGVKKSLTASTIFQLQVGNWVAYAPPGIKIGKIGTNTTGLFLTKKMLMLSLGDASDTIHVFKDEESLDTVHLTQYGALDKKVNVDVEYKRRQDAVANILTQLETGDSDNKYVKMWKQVGEWSLSYFHDIYREMDCRFDHEYFESKQSKPSLTLMAELKSQGKLHSVSGSYGIDFKLLGNKETKSLGYFMLLKSNGSGLYGTKDISLAIQKFQDFKLDQSIYIVANEQNLHFKQVFATLKHFGYTDISNKSKHLSYGMVRLETGKMKSRDGNAIRYDTLMDSLSVFIFENYLKKYSATGLHPDGLTSNDPDVEKKNAYRNGKVETKWTDAEIRTSIVKISLAIIKFGMLKQDAAGDIEFNLNNWGKQTGKTGPYLLYTFTRLRAILAKNIIAGSDGDTPNWNLLHMPNERAILSSMHDFWAILQSVIDKQNPAPLCEFLFNLSHNVNAWIEKMDYLVSEKEIILKVTRLKLIEAVSLVIQKGLHLLGIQTLEIM
jgi:arginyl-tRNA synthetase